MEAMRSADLVEAREEGLVECGQEISQIACAVFHDGIVPCGGEPTQFAWVRLTKKGQAAAIDLQLAQQAEQRMLTGTKDLG